MAYKGIDVRQSGDRILIRVSLKDSSGTKVTTGTTSLSLYELQSDGTLKSYDFNDNTFKTTALTTASVSMTHRTGNNGTVSTGLWTYALTTVSGFTRGNIYIAQVGNSGASPTEQEREFQYGDEQGDFTVDSSGRVDLGKIAGQTASAAAGVTFPASIGTSTYAGGAVASVTGNVGGNVAGSVGSVTGNVGGSVASVTAGVTVATNNDKAGYALSSGGIQAIWDALTSTLTTANSIGKRILDFFAGANYSAPPSASTIANQVDSTLSGTHGSGQWGSTGSGSGARTITIHVTDGTTALENARVRMSAAINTYTAQTNSSGNATFALDDATYTLAITKDGYTYTPTSQVVNGNATINAAMSVNVIPSPSLPSQSVGTLVTVDGQGNPQSGVTLTFRVEGVGYGDTGEGIDTSDITATSGTGGTVQVTLIRGLAYQAQRQSGEIVHFEVPDASTFELPDMLGKP